MKHLLKNAFLLVAASIMMSTPALALTCDSGQFKFKNMSTHKMECRKPTPDEGWQMLLDGNKKFAHNNLAETIVHSKSKVRTALAAGQKPYAIVLTCSDSRLPAEILFDKGLGEIFTVRVAGNVVAPHELGSIDYAVEHLGANLIVVLGHEKCGAVKATYDTYPAHVDVADPILKNIASLTESIYPAVDAVVTLSGAPKPADTVLQAAQVEECVLENIKLVGESLEPQSAIIEEAVIAGTLKIKRAKYDLDTGLVTDVTPAEPVN